MMILLGGRVCAILGKLLTLEALFGSQKKLFWTGSNKATESQDEHPRKPFENTLPLISSTTSEVISSLGLNATTEWSVQELLQLVLTKADSGG
jgi:hypothetical protein